MSEIKTTYSFIPWLRRGLSRQIGETDTFGKSEGVAQKRAKIDITTTFDLYKAEVKPEKRSETMTIDLVGPGDVSGIHKAAILQVVPANGVENFESDQLPFIEFFEEDLPWRYTPAKVVGDKLRPWLALLVCKKEEFELFTDSKGTSFVSLKIEDEAAYKNIFYEPSLLWDTAHVQFAGGILNEKEPVISVNRVLEMDEDLGFSRILSTRKLENDVEYTVFLVPTFETGRLSGLGLNIDTVPAQRSAWEGKLELQNKRERALDFPVYFHWEFKTTEETFPELARKLYPISTDELPAALKVDVQKMGNGLNYSLLKKPPKRKVIDVPVATQPVGFQSTAFPAGKDEKKTASVMREFLNKSPDLAENIELVGTNKEGEIEQTVNVDAVDVGGNLSRLMELAFDKEKREKADKDEMGKLIVELFAVLFKALINWLKKKLAIKKGKYDDPWVVPPLYGAKHTMATSLDFVDNKEHAWFPALNLDVRYRAAAGLGRKTVQQNQEQFVNRAWEQVELINELNQRLREYLLSLQVNSEIFNTRFNTRAVNQLMLYLQPMKNASSSKTGSLNSILNKAKVPAAYASPAFQSLALKKSVPASFSTFTLNDKIINENVFRWKEHQIGGLVDLKYFTKIKEVAKDARYVVERLIEWSPSYWGESFNVKPEISYRREDSEEILNACLDGNKISIERLKKEIEKLWIQSEVPPINEVGLVKFSRLSNFQHFINAFFNKETENGNERISFDIDDVISTDLIRWNCFNDSKSAGMTYNYNGSDTKDSKIRVRMLSNSFYKRYFNTDKKCTYFKGAYYVSEDIMEDKSYQAYAVIGKYSSIVNLKKVGKFFRIAEGQKVKSFELFNVSIYLPINSTETLINLFLHRYENFRRTKDSLEKIRENIAPYFFPGADRFTVDIDLLRKERQVYEMGDKDLWVYYQELTGIISYAEQYNKMVDLLSELNKSDKFKELLGRVTLDDNKVVETPTTDHIKKDTDTLLNELNPLNSEERERIIKFIEEYYREFLSNETLQRKYIEELTHSQYPVMAYPVYPEPVYYYLKQFSTRFILPASESMPDNSMALFVNNPEFVEAFLCGMNTEMGKELLWREYPTDQRGSYFRKFWDTDVKTEIAESLRNENFFDIQPLHKWNKFSMEGNAQYEGRLGQNHMPGKDDLLIFAIKGELLKKYPETVVYLSKAALEGDNTIKINPDAEKMLPDLAAWLGDDLYIVGFPVKLNDLVGNPQTKDPGYFLTFMNRPTETRFGASKGNSNKHAGENAASRLVGPHIYGKHVSQFLSGWV